MSTSNIEFSADSLNNAGSRLKGSADDLIAKTNELLSEVGDSKALGVNDTLGSVASMIYDLAIFAVRECIKSVQESLADHGQKLQEASQNYQTTEDAAAQAAHSIERGL